MHLSRSHTLKNRFLLVCLVPFVLTAFTAVSAQDITILSPTGSTAAKPLLSTGGHQVHVRFTVTDPAKTSAVRIISVGDVEAIYGDYVVAKNQVDQRVVLNLFKGKNIITLLGYSGDKSTIRKDTKAQVTLYITCDDKECGTSEDLIVKEKDSTEKAPKTPKQDDIEIITEGDNLAEGKIAISVKSDIKKVTVTVHDKDDKLVDFKEGLDVKPFGNMKVVFVTLKTAQGNNVIRAYDSTKWAARENATVRVLPCDVDKCGKAVEKESKGLITIKNPESGGTVNSSFRDVDLIVKNDATPISKIKYFVINKGKTVVNADDVPETDLNYKDGEAKALVKIKFVEGQNLVTFFDVNDPLNEKRQAHLHITCAGPGCASDFLVSTVPTNSMNTRVVVGMEQVGASSAASETKPFLDFFFTNGILFNTLKRKVVPGATSNCDPKKVIPATQKEEEVCGPDGQPIRIPRLASWGLIRFSTTPQQTAGFAVLPSNFVNQITDPAEIVELVQSFDYLAGIEVRAFSANGYNWTLLPGVKQKSRFYFTVGGGAISPLNPARTSAQIFKIPTAATEDTPASPQRADFEARFGKPPEDKTYIGFVPLERDRFFRQYYFGIRIKSHFCDNDECSRFKNSFPSMVDVGFGQNEAVTGGTFKQNGKRSWVLRLDTYYPLPFRPANFLYLYGSALMKFGQGGPKIDIPLFLDTAPGEVQITSTDVFIPPPDQQPSRLNRDYYKIGVGVNLTDLFNRNKTPPE